MPEGKKAKRAPSAYNLFMKSEISRVKKAFPSLDHPAAFKKAAGNWKSAKSTFKVTKTHKVVKKSRKSRKSKKSKKSKTSKKSRKSKK